MARKPYDRVAGRQLGLVTSSQLHALGWSRAQIRQAIRRGLLVPLRPGVFRVAGAPPHREQAWLAAALAADGSFLSHTTAATAWGFPHVPGHDGIDLLRVGNRPRLPGVRGHETDHLPPSHTAVRGRLPITSAARTVIDTCGLVNSRQLKSNVNDGLRRKLLSIPSLVRTVEEVPRSGRRAILPVLEFLDTQVEGYDPGDSDPEVDLVDVLVAAGFPPPRQQIPVDTHLGERFIDVGWPEVQVGFEYDSVDHHVHRFHEDRDRLRALKLAGWDIWPITKTTSRNEVLAIATHAFRRQRAA